MYLHILDTCGRSISVLNTRQQLPLASRANLVYQLETHQGVGVRSAHRDLNKLPRFVGSGAILTEHVPETLRDEALLACLDRLTSTKLPPTRSANLAPARTAMTRPTKSRKVSADQQEAATKLRTQGLAWRKVAGMVGVNQTTLRDAMRGGLPRP
jgi:hypothetical protein